jgi:hypothetical protein
MDPEAPTPHERTTARRSRPARRTSRLAMGAVAVLTCGVLSGGVAYAHSSGGSEVGDAPAADSVPRRDHGARGTVAAIDGTTFIVTQRDGTGVSVTTSDTTTFRVTSTATVADATVGSYVVVRGKKADDGSVTAKALAIRPAQEATSSGRAFGVARHWWHGLAGDVTGNDPATGALTISTPNGVVAVLTSADTKVIETTAGTIADLTVGARVGVHGTFADDGTLSAERVKVLPAALTQPDPVPVESTTTTTSTTVVVDPVVTTTTELPSPTTTAPPAAAEEAAVRGIVASVDGTTFAITARDGTTVAVSTDAATRFVVKDCDGAWNKRDDASSDDGNAADDQAASIADVTVGAQVKVVGTAGADGTVLAAAVLIGDDDGRRSGGDRHDDERGDHDGERDDRGGDDRRGRSTRRGDDDGGSDRRGDRARGVD